MSNQEIGCPAFFNLERYLDSVDDMINADEVERAQWMLANLPGWYRDHVPERVKQMRERLHRQMFTPVQYKGLYKNVNLDMTNELHWPGRAQVTENIVKAMNEKSVTPNIMEFAPGSFWLPHGLTQKGLQFGYESLGLDDDHPELKPVDGPNIFIAFEIIEHLANEWEIYQNYLKFNKPAQTILLSTPLYTYGGGMDNWQTRELGHLRTYTPKEFVAKAQEMFQGFTWEVFTDSTIILVGRKNA